MGEISAKHLRGESMADVIFNGSAARKPLGTASVELVFDNSDGKIGGAYATYNEVVAAPLGEPRRHLGLFHQRRPRSGARTSPQLFLGTGLGSRSYAIIEQGMISRLIEARPDDLRAFLEEAAGISRYKERRRETENRIAETRENLDRLNDLREEVEKQIRHLQRQAGTAAPLPGAEGGGAQASGRGVRAAPAGARRGGGRARCGHGALRDGDAGSRSRICASRNRRSSGFASISPRKADALGAIQERFYAAGSEVVAHRAEHSTCARAAASPAHGFGAGAGSGP